MNYIKWKISESGGEAPQSLLDAGYNRLIASLLRLRGIGTPEEAKAFLNCGPERLEDPMLMKGMQTAAARIRRAMVNKELVAVYGDYDVDGITATCMMSSWIRSKGLKCLTYIPDRIEEGYGLNSAAIKRLKDWGVSLIITVDCGITAVEEARYAAHSGLDLIITDHHECREQTVPMAAAVIDPKQESCGYPNKDLAGVGVALKLICAVEGDSRRAVNEYADLAAIGTIADVVPLTGENRYIVRKGLEKLGRAPRPGIAALLRESGLEDKRINSAIIGFTLAPRLNAAGRLGSVSVATQLLMTRDPDDADRLAAELCELNRRRQSLETEIWADALNMMSGQEPDVPIVLSSDIWHQGVIGIAASRLAEQHCLPTVMICLDGDKGKGSCRSFGDFNLFAALSACSEHLESFGGHALAAGLNIRRDKLEDFRRAFADYYREHMPQEPPTLCCDLEICDPDMLSMDCVKSLSLMEPFGSGNQRPVLCMMGVLVERILPIGNGRHLRINVSYMGQSFECIYFSHTEDELAFRAGDRADIAFSPQINDFHYRFAVQLQIISVRRHDPRPLCERLLVSPGAELPLTAAPYCPDRNAFVSVWRRLQSMGGRVAADIDGVIRQSPADIEPERFCICLRVLLELGLIRLIRDGSLLGAAIVSGSEKVNLADSQLIMRLKARCGNGIGDKSGSAGQ